MTGDPAPAASAAPLLAVERLTTVFDAGDRALPAVDQVSFSIASGETLGLVGESGSGKSVTALSIMRLVEPPGRIAGGSVRLRGRELLTLTERAMREVRGGDITLIFQEPMTALNPVFSVGNQIAEALLVHKRVSRARSRQAVVELLASVRVPDPDRRYGDYPHQLSGGLRQRVMIAIALACRPALLIADEPATALDATLHAQILDLLRDLKTRFELSLLLITHDLGVVAETADRVAIMYTGRIVEQGSVRDIFHHPSDPYTRGLLASMPGGAPGARLKAIEGTVPPLGQLPAGCAFAPRCPDRMDRCEASPPEAVSIAPGHDTRCYLHDNASGGPS